MAGRKPVAKAAATKVETTEPKTESIKAEEKVAEKTTEKTAEKATDKVAEKAPEVKKEPVKKAATKATVAKKETAKKEPVKKETASKTKAAATKKAVKECTMHIQFSGKSYSQEDLMKMAKDVWRYDLKQKAGDLNSVELYVKPEENMVYYVMNEKYTGSFVI